MRDSIHTDLKAKQMLSTCLAGAYHVVSKCQAGAKHYPSTLNLNVNGGSRGLPNPSRRAINLSGEDSTHG